MHSHHSHSGDYVSHAVDKLDDIVELAYKKGFTVFCLTEHMPRLHDKYLYPEEIEKGYTVDDLKANFRRYLVHALQLKQKYTGKMAVLVGFEVEGIDSDHIDYASQILQDPTIDMMVGSVHYVNQIPIDFSPSLWLEARNSVSEKTTRSLYKAYFELQYEVIQKLHPQVVGHFDLIRLFEPREDDPTTGKHSDDLVLEHDWPEVWQLIVRNIKTVVAYGGMFEVNSAAIRKGWTTPYPKRDIADAIVQNGGKFCLSDDSHGLAQIGLNFHKSWDYIKQLGVENIYHLDLVNGNTILREKNVLELDKSEFWKLY